VKAEDGFSGYLDGLERVTGRVPYVLNMSRPGMLHAAILRSPYPHARILSVDPRPALKILGVVTVLTREDLERGLVAVPRFGSIIRDQPIVSMEKAHYAGAPVAAVAAIDRETAKEAARLIEVEYAELPAVTDIDAAIAPGAPVVHETLDIRTKAFPDVVPDQSSGTNNCNHFRLRRGDIDAGFAESELVVEGTYRMPGTQHVPMETHVVIAELSVNGSLTVWAATQTPYLVRAQLAETFDLPESRVRVIVPTLGSGYGAKTYPKLEALVAALAMKAGAPVKLVLDRDEEFLTIRKHDALIKIKTGARRDGTLLARKVELWWDAGAYADVSPRFAMFGGFYAPGPYRIPNVMVDSHAVYTNKPPAGAFRGYAAPEVAMAYETHLEMVAEQLGIDPIELRSKNILRAGDRYATGEVMDDLHFPELLDDVARALESAPERGEPLLPHMRRGKGVAAVMMATITPSTSTAVIKMNGDGSVHVLSSTVEMGQGSRTALSQIAADALTVPLDRVAIVDPDTDVTPFDLTSSASRGTFMMGCAVLAAADDAKDQLLRSAAELLEANAADLELRDGGIFVKKTSRGAPFPEIIRSARAGTIVGRGAFTTKGGLAPGTGQGIASAQWHPCTAGVEVEVDTETGTVRILKIHVNTYAGRLINRTTTELQLEGAAIFGLGAVMMEEMVYDNGRLLNPSLADYMIPSFLDVPAAFTTTVIEDHDEHAVPHGLGENGVGPIPAAVAAAVYDAVGVRLNEWPLTPEKVLRALRQAGR
jgi:CO/xanthine dehydrogenase Mo-binding subunit